MQNPFYVSRLDSVYDENPKRYDLSIILKEIREGKTTIANSHTAEDFEHRTLAAYTHYIRELSKNPEKALAIPNLKKSLPQIAPAGILLSRSEISEFAGLVCLEYDDSEIDFDSLLADASQIPHVTAAFRSISQKAKILIHVASQDDAGEVLSLESFKHAWDAARRLFEYHGEPDIQSCHPIQLQGFCYDPQLYMNLETTELAWHVDESGFEETHGTIFSGTAEHLGGLEALGENAEKYQNFINAADTEDRWKDNGWSRESVPCPFTDHENDSWEYPKNNGTGVHQNHVDDDGHTTNVTLHCFKCGASGRYGLEDTDDFEKDPAYDDMQLELIAEEIESYKQIFLPETDGTDKDHEEPNTAAEDADEPDKTKIQHLDYILDMVSKLGSIAQAEAVDLLMKPSVRDIHKMNKNVLEKEVRDKSREYRERKKKSKKKFGSKPSYSPNLDESSDYFGEKGKFLPTPMMDFLDTRFHIRQYPNEKQLRIYRGGVYKPDFEKHIGQAIQNELGADAKHFYVTEVLSMLHTRHMQPTSEDGIQYGIHPDHINLKNGLYNIYTGDFTNHTPDFVSFIQLPIEYNPGAKCPEIDKFLSDVLQANADDIKLAHEIAGYAMLQQLPIPALFVLLGPTHTGKSTFIDILVALLGSVNVSGISLQALDDENMRFARAGLYGKLANMSADLSKRVLSGDSNIKKISAGDRFEVERKGVDPFFMRPFSTLICATNEMPKSRDKSDAWLERLIILPFVKQHKGDQVIRNYLDRLTTPNELSGLFNHAITGIKRILDTGNFTITQNVKDAKSEYELDNNSAARFITENTIADDAAKLVEDSLYPAYTDWCENEGIQTPFTKTSFRKNMEEHGYKRKRGRKNDNTRYYYFEGVRWQNASDTATTPEEFDDDIDPYPEIGY